MNKITKKIFFDLVKEYNEEALNEVKKAYQYSEKAHKGQYRLSGEPYIIHPLNVAYILAEMYADQDTLCAGLLHDVLEDTKVTKEDLIESFGVGVANLVDGVTNITDLNFSSKQDQRFANERKIITSITTDVRIIIIKLADRLHNMRTLQYKDSEKQKEKSLETIEVFVPLAYDIGAYKIKRELEDLSLYYLDLNKYNEIELKLEKIKNKNNKYLNDMINIIQNKLRIIGIECEIKPKFMSIYDVYKRTLKGESINSIHDLITIRIVVDTEDNCYRALGIVHSEYPPINEKIKDYICRPKTNMYKSIHTTVFALYGDILVKFLIRTKEMELVATYGLSSYWYMYKGEARIMMQKDLQEKYQFVKSLSEIIKEFSNNQEFLIEIKNKLFSDNKIFVYTSRGEVIEMPPNSTAKDFAYKIHTELGDNITGAIVNGNYESSDYILKTGDRITILTEKK